MKKKLIIFSGPSGVGKSTIEKKLFNDASLNLCLSCSMTTRKPRKNEKHGQHYYFVTLEEFDKKIASNAFLEWNYHFGNKYGTLKSEIDRIENQNKIPFLEIETFGAKNVMKALPQEKIISFFIIPPSMRELKKRIFNRGTEDNDQIQKRLEKFNTEILEKKYFQHVIINDNVKKTVEKIKTIIKESLK